MKRKILLYFLMFSFAFTFAQVTVFGSAETNAGDVNKTYATLASAFSALNSQTSQAGNVISIEISASTTETSQASLNQPSVSCWKSLKIYPTVSGLSISSTYAGAAIYLNGADSVTIDGSVGGVGSIKNLIIINNDVSNGAIQLTNNASYNTIKNCVLKGGASNSNSAVIWLSGGTDVVGGNDYNTITNNDITNNGVGRPTYAINIQGVAPAAPALSVVVDGTTISNNNIFDVMPTVNTANSAAYIYISTYTSATSISANSLYETTPVTWSPTGASILRGIYVNSTVAQTNGIAINSNYIGGTASLCGGDTLKINSTAVFNFYAIDFNGSAVTGTSHSINNNFIQKIQTIGTSAAQQLLAVKTSCPVLTVSGNKISDLKNVSSSGSSFIQGIVSTGTSSLTISNNTIKNLETNAPCGGYDGGVSVGGIIQQGACPAVSINANIIMNLLNTSATQGIRLSGITFVGTNSSATGVVANANFIKGISAPNTTYSLITGFRSGNSGSAITLVNNVIALGDASASYVAGIFDRNNGSTAHHCYFNTVVISGTASGSSQNTFAYQTYNQAANAGKDVRNNIFVNTHTNPGGSGGLNYAIAVNGTSGTVDYNNYWVSGTNTKLGMNSNDLAALQTETGGLTHSANIDPAIPNLTGNFANDYASEAALNIGTPITGFTTDIKGNNRDAATPRIGAFEVTYSGVFTSNHDVAKNDIRISTNATGVVVLFEGISKVELYSVNGVLLDSETVNGIYVNAIKNGIYIIKVNGKAMKFIK